MNTNNHGSLEACQRLADAGIVLETDCFHVFGQSCVNGKPPIMTRKEVDALLRVSTEVEYILAVQFTEVWRELPEEYSIDNCICDLTICRSTGKTFASYCWYQEALIQFANTNPTDALIDLLIFVRKELKP